MAMQLQQNTKKAVTNTQQRNKQAIYSMLQHKEVQKQLVNILGNEKQAKKFASEVYINVSINPELENCTPESFVRTAFQYAQANLSANPLLGQAWMIPYNNKDKGVKEVNFQLGYKGLVALARRSASVLDVDADIVYENDTFSHSKTETIEVKDGFVLVTQPLEHEPSDGGRGNMKLVYAKALLKEGNVITRKHIVMSIKEVEAHRAKYSKYGKVWASDFEAMALKTVLAKLCKKLPLSTEVQNAIEVQEDYREDSEVETMTQAELEVGRNDVVEADFTKEEKSESNGGENPLAV